MVLLSRLSMVLCSHPASLQLVYWSRRYPHHLFQLTGILFPVALVSYHFCFHVALPSRIMTISAGVIFLPCTLEMSCDVPSHHLAVFCIMCHTLEKDL